LFERAVIFSELSFLVVAHLQKVGVRELVEHGPGFGEEACNELPFDAHFA